MFTAAVITIAEIRKGPRCPSVGEWTKKAQRINAKEYYLAVNQNEILPFATTEIDLEGVVLSEISQGKTNTI